MKTRIILIILVISNSILFGQKNKIPKNIEQALEILQIDCPDSLQQIMKNTPNDSLIYLSYPWGGEYKTISEWTTGLKSKRKTKLEKYYLKLGVKYPKHIMSIVLISFKTILNEENLNHQKIIEPFQNIENKWNKEDKIKFTTDTLREIYIPKDLEDCFVQIDKFWTDSLKNEIKILNEDEFVGRVHFGFGMWMRNNWQLWGGSRLSKYFNEMGIYHPDDMSGIILTSYHRRLIEEKINLGEQIKYYQNYWQEAKKKN